MSPKRVLVVDDDPDIRELVGALLEPQGYQVGTAPDGLSCLMKAQSERPDLIILDLGLPAGDGLTALQRLRAIDGLSTTPVLVLSARDPLLWKERALHQGASAYLEKPVDKEGLLEHVRSLVGSAGVEPTGSVSACPHCGAAPGSRHVTLDPASVQALADAIRALL